MLNGTKGISLLLQVWEQMESHTIPSRFQPAAEVGHVTNFGRALYPWGLSQLVSPPCPTVIPLATVPCLPHSRTIIHIRG